MLTSRWSLIFAGWSEVGKDKQSCPNLLPCEVSAHVNARPSCVSPMQWLSEQLHDLNRDEDCSFIAACLQTNTMPPCCCRTAVHFLRCIPFSGLRPLGSPVRWKCHHHHWILLRASATEAAGWWGCWRTNAEHCVPVVQSE